LNLVSEFSNYSTFRELREYEILCHFDPRSTYVTMFLAFSDYCYKSNQYRVNWGKQAKNATVTNRSLLFVISCNYCTHWFSLIPSTVLLTRSFE